MRDAEEIEGTRRALAILDRKLHEPESVPCPQCGWLQSPTVELTKRRSLGNGLKLIAGLTVLAWIVAFAGTHNGWLAVLGWLRPARSWDSASLRRGN